MNIKIFFDVQNVEIVPGINLNHIDWFKNVFDAAHNLFHMEKFQQLFNTRN